MRMLSKLFFALALLSTAASGAHAALLFDDGTGNFTSFRTASNPPSGAGLGIAVSTTTSLTNIGADIAMPSGGNVEFMIWDATNSTLLLTSASEAMGSSSTPAYVTSPNFNFTLNAGQTYYFGVIGDNDININFWVPPQSFDQNGLSALLVGNSNYTNFASPLFTGIGGGEMALQLFGTQNVPEPITLSLFGTGLAGAVAMRRRKKIAA
jgi:hypothetical protein